MSDRIYFSAADRQLESYLSDDDFDRSLFLNVFFQAGILVPDIFCFISDGLRRHMQRGKLSLFEAAIEKDIVVPAFRDPDTTSFKESLAVIKGQGIQAVRSETADDIAERLQNAAERNNQFRPEHWPTHDVGMMFGRMIDDALATEEPPSVVNDSSISRVVLAQRWRDTQRWRIGSIARAREMAQEAGRPISLRRGDIMNAVGEDVGLPRGHKVNDVRELFAAQQGSEFEKRALRLFCRWLSDCYQLNGAEELNSIANFPIHDPIGGAVALGAIKTQTVGSTRQPDAVIRESVPFPPFGLLRMIKPMGVIDARRDYGAGYFAALANWQSNPTSSNEATVRLRLREYANELVRWARRESDFTSTVLDVLIASGATPFRRVLGAAFAFAATITATQRPEVAPLVAAGGLGFAVYLWQLSPKEKQPVELAARRFTSELNVNTSLGQNLDLGH